MSDGDDKPFTVEWGPEALAFLESLPPDERAQAKADIEAQFKNGPPAKAKRVPAVERGTRVCPGCSGVLEVKSEVSRQGPGIPRQNILVCVACDESFTEILEDLA